MKICYKLSFLICGVVFTMSCLQAEDITTTDGQIYRNSTLRRNGSLIMVKITNPGSSGIVETGLPIARIAKVDFPEPPELALAKKAASDGNAQEVINLTANYVSSQLDFKDLPGSWWPAMAKICLLAQASVGNDSKVANLARQLGETKSADADTISRGGTLFEALKSNDTEAVVVGAAALPRIGGGTGSALAQLALGRALFLKKNYPGALRAFLTIKVFYPSCSLLQPAALMGAAKAYIALNDTKRAMQSLQDIISLWPASPQVPEAKKRLEILSHS
jgi:tetratricopeptide (TPR) repeat protein